MDSSTFPDSRSRKILQFVQFCTLFVCKVVYILVLYAKDQWLAPPLSTYLGAWEIKPLMST